MCPKFFRAMRDASFVIFLITYRKLKNVYLMYFDHYLMIMLKIFL